MLFEIDVRHAAYANIDVLYVTCRGLVQCIHWSARI